MPALREDVIAAICAEDWPHPDHEVSSTSIYERLQRGGVNTSEAEVQQVLFQLSQDKVIVLAPDQQYGPVVHDVAEGLCP
jgi:lauroyl/myristoyl acyltransferase